MKKIFTLIALAWLSISSISAQTMTLTIEGKEVKNGDNIVIDKVAKATKVGPLTLYDLGVETDFKSLIAQTVITEGIDLDQITPGLACCPPGFTCTTASADNNWVSTGEMPNLEVGKEVTGEWIHYNYQRNKPVVGSTRKSKITLKGASETISFNLTINVADETGIHDITVDEENVAAQNIAGQQVSKAAKGILIKNGKKYIVK